MKTNCTMISDQGKIRDNNEDNFVFDCFMGSGESSFEKTRIINTRIQSFGIFDGMGGSSSGEIASKIAAKMLLDHQKNWADMNDIDVNKALMTLVTEMNVEICQEIASSKERMGSTATILVLNHGKAYLSHLGDSSCLLFRNDELTKFSTDHVDNYIPNQHLKRKPKLTQYLGIPQEEFILIPDQKEIDLHSNDVFILMSDGLSDLVEINEIENIMLKSTEITSARESIFSLYFSRGATDNITLILLQLLDHE